MSHIKRLSAEEEFARIETHFPNLSPIGCSEKFCQGGRQVVIDEPRIGDERPKDVIERDAVDLLRQLRRDGVIDNDQLLNNRVQTVVEEIRVSGGWKPTFTELEHGMRLSWKNSRRCIMKSEFMTLRYEAFYRIL